MKKVTRMVGVTCGAALLVMPFISGCDDDEDDFDDPSVSILSPSAGTVQELESDDMRVDISIDADDFELNDAADCEGDVNCGRAVLKIDGDACNAAGLPYNVATGDDRDERTTLEADFSLCPADKRIGSHQVTVSLQRHDGTPVMRVDGAPAEATITFVTEMDDD